MIQEYIDAFTSCYPQKRCEVKQAFNREGKFIGFRVGIDGDFGNLVLTAEDLRDATRAFKR